MVTSKNDSLNPTKRQVNKRMKRLTGLKRSKTNRLRRIERKHRKSINRAIRRKELPGEAMLNGNMNMDNGAKKLRSGVDSQVSKMQMKMTKIRF